MQPSKQDLLDHYATKEPQRFLQRDGFCDHWVDTTLRPDRDGDSSAVGMTAELMSTPGRTLPLRILIHEDADQEDVRRLMRKALAALDRDFEELREQQQRDVLERAGVDCAEETPF